MDKLNERANTILTAVVEHYIETAQPLGSRTLSKKYGIGLSPATIRNIMADLEDAGFLTQPHTSAGRIPTEKGYRYYVDFCISRGQKVPEAEMLPVPRPRGRLLEKDVPALLTDVTQELSKESHHMGIAVAPRVARSRLARVELIGVRDDQVLAVVITEEGIVRNLLLKLEERYSQKHLNEISAYINRELGGKTFEEARRRILDKVYEDRAAYDNLLTRAIRIGREIVSRQVDEKLFVGGISELLEQADVVNMEALREIFRAIEDKHLIIQLFNMIEEMEGGVQVLIGSENPLGEMHDCSLVVSPYQKQGRVIGTVGVIGPIRMAYPRVITMVEKTAKYLTNVFSEMKGD